MTDAQPNETLYRSPVRDIHEEADALRDALEQLCCYVTNGTRRYDSRNPYGVPAVANALKVLADTDGKRDYLGALDGVTPRFNED